MTINGSDNTHRIDKLVLNFIKVRNKIQELEEQHEKELEPFKALREDITGRILEFFDTTGQKSARTEHGTASISVRYTSPLTDPDAFMQFVRDHDAYELMDRRANSTAIRDFAEENNGSLPPGVKLSATRLIGVRKS